MFYAISSLVDMITECYEVTVTVYWQFTTDTKNNLKWGLRKPHQVFTGSPPTYNLVDKYKSTSYRSIRLNSGRINSLALQLYDKTRLPFCKQHTSALIRTRHFRVREVDSGSKLDKQTTVPFTNSINKQSSRNLSRIKSKKNLQTRSETMWLVEFQELHLLFFNNAKYAFICVYRWPITRRYVHLRHGAFIFQNTLSITISA